MNMVKTTDNALTIHADHPAETIPGVSLREVPTLGEGDHPRPTMAGDGHHPTGSPSVSNNVVLLLRWPCLIAPTIQQRGDMG
jgi:hypothetical protein